MPRALRRTYPGALHHVTARGNRQEPIFLDVDDRRLFLALLGEVVERFGWICHAYCLMGNHYHLLVETPEQNLSEGMCRLNGRYARLFNERHLRRGHVFGGRFHSMLVERQSYLLEVARYIVLNPVRAGLCASPGEWPWSSFNATIGAAPSAAFLRRDELLGSFSATPARRRQRFATFVLQAADQPRRMPRTAALGSPSFMDMVRELRRRAPPRLAA